MKHAAVILLLVAAIVVIIYNQQCEPTTALAVLLKLMVEEEPPIVPPSLRSSFVTVVEEAVVEEGLIESAVAKCRQVDHRSCSFGPCPGGPKLGQALFYHGLCDMFLGRNDPKFANDLGIDEYIRPLRFDVWAPNEEDNGWRWTQASSNHVLVDYVCYWTLTEILSILFRRTGNDI